MNLKPIQVLIIEENSAFRKALKQQIVSSYPMMACEEANGEQETIEKINQRVPHIIFSGYTQSEGSGLELIRLTRKMCPDALIVSMTHEKQSEYETAAVESGASYGLPVLKPDLVDGLPLHVPETILDNIVNKRKFQRYTARNIIDVSLKSDTRRQWGKLLDISKGGLAISYYETDKPNGQFTDLSIFPSNYAISIENLKFRTVCDFKLTDIPMGIRSVRRSGLQFENLTGLQQADLSSFVEDYASEKP